MKTCLLLVLSLMILVAVSCRDSSEPKEMARPVAGARGSLHGHVRLDGPIPQNEPIHMNADPMCNKVNAGRRVENEAVVAGADGSLANVFVELTGTFPDTPVPKEPVSIDQQGCVYRPRVVGLRAGQTLQVRNSDDGLHNVHGISTPRDSFNIGQPMAGLVNSFHPQDHGMLQLKCDVHTWMVAYVGVVDHPFFRVTGDDGAFELRDVPEGTYSVRTWHERFGTKTTPVQVEGGKDAVVDVVFTAP